MCLHIVVIGTSIYYKQMSLVYFVYIGLTSQWNGNELQNNFCLVSYQIATK